MMTPDSRTDLRPPHHLCRDWLAQRRLSKLALVNLSLTILFAFLVEMRGIGDVDLFWQLKCGQIMLETGKVCNIDTFSYTHFGEKVPCIYWLSQLIWAVLYRVGSWRALLIVHCLIFAGAFGIAGHVARRGRAGPFSVSAAMALGFSTGLTNSDLRPHGFALCCFAILLMLVSGELRWRVKLPLAVLVLLFWQNTHPSVVVGGLAVAGLAAADWIDCLRARAREKPWGLTLLLLLIALCQFATPMGIGVLRTSRDNLRVARTWLKESEWLPPWDPGVDQTATMFFWVAMGITAVLLVIVRKRVSLRQWFTVCGMTVLALSASRFVLFWGLAMIPVWADWIEMVKSKESFQWGNDPTPRWAFIAVLLGGVILVLVVPSRLQSSIIDDRIPLEGIRVLKASLPEGRIYNFRQWGGPLILGGSPQWKVNIDGRLYMYTNPRDWQEYRGAAVGSVPLEHLVREHRVDAFFLHPSLQKPLVDSIRRTRSWSRIHETKNVIVFVKADK
jgi:hypothetical protein